MSSSVIDHVLVREIEARAARLDSDEFVEFSFAGEPAAGHFCCAVCGRNVTCVGLLPPCSDCGSRLWEDPRTSPFAVSEPSPVSDAYEQWIEDDLDSTARALVSFPLAILLGLTFWALLATVLSVAYAVMR